MAALFDTLLTKQGPKPAAEVLAGKITAIYFSAHWCPPCRGFTPKLAEAYTTHLQQKGLEVVFVSSDQDEASFDAYYAEMPWAAVAFGDRAKKDQLSTKFGVRGIPMLVLVDESGEMISTEGRAMVMQDPQGVTGQWPWLKAQAERPSGSTVASASHPLFDTLLTKQGPKPAAEVLAGKLTAIYFSAHWCPPCRGFTPKLAEAYTTHLQQKGLEVVFVSSDQDEASFDAYYAGMPWTAVAFGDRAKKEQLSTKFGVKGIPMLVLVDESGELISTEGRAMVMQDPQGVTGQWPWLQAQAERAPALPAAHAKTPCCTIC